LVEVKAVLRLPTWAAEESCGSASGFQEEDGFDDFSRKRG